MHAWSQNSYQQLYWTGYKGGLPKKPESISETGHWRETTSLALFEIHLLKIMQPNDPLIWTFLLPSDPCSCCLLVTFGFGHHHCCLHIMLLFKKVMMPLKMMITTVMDVTHDRWVYSNCRIWNPIFIHPTHVTNVQGRRHWERTHMRMRWGWRQCGKWETWWALFHVKAV